ncbi:MAG: hypothetical protein FWG74_09670 [Planctomycetes bacterium]|nr:hypothetical protein [Planctomycetota bacterium]
MRLHGWVMAAAAVLFGGSVLAQDANAAVPADNIASLRGQATITIEGVAAVSTMVHNVKQSDGDRAKITEFEAQKMELTFKVAANENAYLVTTLAMTDAWYDVGNYEQDEFLKEVYFVFDNIWCTGLGVKFGKQELPFGYVRDDLLVHPYMDARGNSALTKMFNGVDYSLTTGWFAPFFEAHPAVVDRTFAVTPYYKLGDKLEVAFSLAQGNRYLGVNKQLKSNDNMLFKTMAAQVQWTPIENLILQASGLVQYDRDGGAIPNTTSRAYATSLSADYTFQIACRPFNVFAEWMHGWNPSYYGIGAGYGDNSSSDNIYAGISYKFTDSLKVLTQGEWLRQRDRDPGNWRTRETLWRWVLATQYELSSGMILEGGYQYERGRQRFDPEIGVPGKTRASANTVFAGVHWAF